MSLPTLPFACRASSVITFVPASLYRRQETHGCIENYFCDSMVMASQRISIPGKTHRILVGRIGWIGPILTPGIANPVRVRKARHNRGVSMPCDAIVMASKRLPHFHAWDRPQNPGVLRGGAQ